MENPIYTDLIANIHDFNLKRKAFDSILRKRNSGKTFIEGHRGCNKEEDENTIAAFSKAIEYGCDSIEFDVWLTKDKIPIVIHGSEEGNIKETTNGDGEVHTYTLEDISKFSTNWKNHKIPTLEQVIQLCKNKIFMNIEIKEKNFTLECIEKVIEAIIRHNVKNQVAISTFQQDSWHHLKNYSDFHSIELGFLYDKLQHKNIEFHYDVSKQNATMNVWHGDITLELVQRAHMNNIAVHCWFCMDDKEDEEIIQYLINCGVDVICCNFPSKAIEVRDKIYNNCLNMNVEMDLNVN